MPKYVILSDACEDLETIDSFTVKNWGIEQANAYMAGLDAVFKLLAVNPFAGRDRSEDLGADYMSFGYKSHLIYYKKIKDGIAVAAVLHHSMIPQKHLQSRD